MASLKDMLRDLKNGEPPKALADSLHARGLVFVHVPKCAGTSVETAIRSAYRVSRKLIDPETSFTAAVKETGLKPSDKTRHQILNHASEMRRTMLHYYLAQGVKCITGHAPLSAKTIPAYSNSHDFVTVLRDPVERFCSHLAYNLEGGGGHGAITEPIETFLDRPRAKTMGALYGKYFSGLAMDADFTTADAIEKSKDNLERMAVVGFVDALDDFAGDITCLTGNKISVGLRNPTGAARKMRLELSADNLDKILTLTAADRQIYEWARKHFFVDLTENTQEVQNS